MGKEGLPGTEQEEPLREVGWTCVGTILATADRFKQRRQSTHASKQTSQGTSILKFTQIHRNTWGVWLPRKSLVLGVSMACAGRRPC
jgi:hypothetical protein